MVGFIAALEAGEVPLENLYDGKTLYLEPWGKDREALIKVLNDPSQAAHLVGWNMFGTALGTLTPQQACYSDDPENRRPELAPALWGPPNPYLFGDVVD